MAVNREKLAELRASRQFSQAALARAAQVSQQLIGQLESGAVRSTKALPKIARALGVAPGVIDPDWEGVAVGAATAEGGPIPSSKLVSSARDLEVYAAAEAGEGVMIVTTEAVDWVRRPDRLTNVKNSYGLIVVGDSMIPRYRAGDILLINPNLPPRAHDGIVLYAGDLDGTVRATVKEFVRSTSGLWIVQRYHPKRRQLQLSRKNWPICHVVIGSYTRT